MSTADKTAAPAVHAATEPGFRRGEVKPQRFADILVVEFRKLFATRANRVLMGSLLLLMLVSAVALVAWHDDLFPTPEPWVTNASFVGLPSQMLFPPLLILLVTTEWGTRSAMTTFTLVPRRGVVILAKALVALAATVAVWATGAVLGIAVGLLVHGDKGLETSTLWVGVDVVGKYLLMTVITFATAFALALLLHNTAAAIAVVLGVPTVIPLMSQLTRTLAELVQWVDIHSAAQIVLLEGNNDHLPQLLSSVGVWIVLPLAVGTWWTMHREAS